MRFLLDHDVRADLAGILRTKGHEVTRLIEVLPCDTPDEKVWVYSCEQSLLLISCNRQDFLALAAASKTYPGLIVLIRRRTLQAEAAHLLDLLAHAGESGLANNINFA